MRMIRIAIELFDPRYELRRMGESIRAAERGALRFVSVVGVAILSLLLYLGVVFLTAAATTERWAGPLLAGQPVQDAAKQIDDSVRDRSALPTPSMKRKIHKLAAALRSFPHRVAFVLTALILSIPLAPMLNLPCRRVRLRTPRLKP